MEVEGVPVDGDDAAAGMIPAEEGTDSDGDEPESDDMDYGVWTVEYKEVVGGDDVDGDEMDGDEKRPTKKMRSPARQGALGTWWTATMMGMLPLHLSTRLGPRQCSMRSPLGTSSTHVSFRSK